jgi:hypothetical protein
MDRNMKTSTLTIIREDTWHKTQLFRTFLPKHGSVCQFFRKAGAWEGTLHASQAHVVQASKLVYEGGRKKARRHST